jgi:hypothetical protein
MQIHIDTEEQIERERIVRRMLYSLHAGREDIDCVRLSLTTTSDALGVKRYRCRLHTTLRDGQFIELDETQSNSELAVTRALERCARTARRRLYHSAQRRIMRLQGS